MVGSTRYDLPLAPGVARKWDAVTEQVDMRIIGRRGVVRQEDSRFRLIKNPITASRTAQGIAFYASLPFVVAAEIRRFRPAVVITQSPYEAFVCLARWPRSNPPKLIVEVHGDWRTASRLYGSRVRRMYAGLADRAAHVALRRADATRTLSPFTARLAEEATGQKPIASYVTYFDLESFTAEPARPLPEQPAVAWIGVLQRYKNPQLLADAWRIAAPQVPGARLVVLGDGPLRPIIDELVRQLPDQVRAIPRLEPPEVAKLLDESTLLAMSSNSEGLGRVILEAFARGRPVVAPAEGGPPDVVTPDHNGLLVPPRDAGQLASALVRILGDPALAKRLGRGALEDAQHPRWGPSGYARAVREMVDRVQADSPPL
jgi:glycosyltransferase involved in cell wall biosynthesis